MYLRYRSRSQQAVLEALRYLQDPNTDLNMLKNHLYISQIFFKYNVILPSSASVERMFTYATFIDTPRRHALTDSNLPY